MLQTWSDLQQADPELCSPFFAPGFAQAVGQVRDDLWLGVIEDAGWITGLLPFHRKRGGIGVPVGGQLCDYQGVIGTAPDGGEMLKGFGLVSYDFNHALAAQPLFAGNAFSHSNSPRADLRQGLAAWEAEVGAQTKALKTLARKERKIVRELGDLRFELNDPDDAAWDIFTDWKDANLRGQGGRGFLVDGWDADLISALRGQDTGKCAGVFSTLYAGDRLVAAHFGIRSARAWHWWFPAYDPDLGNYSAGLILMVRCIARAAEDGVAEFDFGRGTQRYKMEFSNRARPLCEGSLERVTHPVGVLRGLHKLAQRQGARVLSERHANLMRRAGTKVLRAGLL